MSAPFAKSLLAALTASDFADKAASVYFESLRYRYADIRRVVEPSGNFAQDATDMKALEAKAMTGDVSMSDALRYERLAVRCADEDAVPAILRSVRSHYRRFCTPAEYQSYLQRAGEPKGKDAREEIDSLLGKIQDTYVLAPFREMVRSQLTMRISFALIICTAGILAFCGALTWVGGAQSHKFPWWLVFAAISGAAGGLVSVHFRIQSLTVAGDSIRGALALCNGWFSVYFAPVIGAIAAMLLALLFRGGLISGELFPDFDTAGVSVWNGKLLAKLLVWSFIAGFIERLVPDTLTRLSDAVGGYRFPQQAEQDRSRAETTTLLEDRRRLKPQDPRVDGSTQHVEPPVATPPALSTETTVHTAPQ